MYAIRSYYACHNPHVSVRQTDTGHFNKACTGCHTGPHGGCTADDEALVASSFNCVHCHMPASGATDIPHVRVTDHFIRKPLRPGLVDSIRTFAGIACINDPDPPGESKGRAFINYFEKFGFDRFVLDSARRYFPDGTEERNNFV